MSVTRRHVLLNVLAGGTSGADGVERLLGFEERLAVAYADALRRDAIDGALGRSLLAHEREHVRGVGLALKALDRRPEDVAPSPPPGEALEDRRSFARFALGLEEQTVRAYVRVLATLDAPELLQPLGSIMTSGAQHQVALRHALGAPLLARKH